MRVIFTVTDVSRLKSVFKFDVGYIDVLVMKHSVVFCFDSVGVFGSISMPVSSYEEFEDNFYLCRIDKNCFLSLVTESVITLSIYDTKVIVRLETGKSVFMLSCGKQIVSSGIILDKLAVLAEATKYQRINLDVFRVPLKLCKGDNFAVNVRDEYLHFDVGGISVYSKVNVQNISAFSRHLAYILNVSDYAYLVQQYLAVVQDNVAILVNCASDRYGGDIDGVRKSAVLGRFKVDFTGAIFLMHKIHKAQEVLLSLDSRELIIRVDNDTVVSTIVPVEYVYASNSGGNSELNVDAILAGSSMESKVKLSDVSFPGQLFLDLLVSLGVKTFDIFVTKYFLRVRISPTLFLVCRRSTIQ
jgi:hypothetical protein